MALLIYRVLCVVLVPFYLLVILYKGTKESAYFRGIGERFGFYKGDSDAVDLWIHGSSLGEVQTAGKTIVNLLEGNKNMQALFTTNTPAGLESLSSLCTGIPRLKSCYAPIELRWVVRRLLKKYRPRCLILVEAEFFPIWIHECKKQDIKVIVSNGRLSDGSAKAYKEIPSLFRPMFKSIDKVLARTSKDFENFKDCGVDPAIMEVTGDLKLDIRLETNKHNELWLENWKVKCPNRPVVIFGSTHEEEHKALMKMWKELVSSFTMDDRPLLFWAPRHLKDFDVVEGLIHDNDMNTVSIVDKWATDYDKCDLSTDVVIVNCFGQLSNLYTVADIAFIGGSMVGGKGHNIAEPTSRGVATITGPFHETFNEMIKEIVAKNGMVTVTSFNELKTTLGRLLRNQDEAQSIAANGKAFFQGQSQATSRTLTTLRRVLAA